LFPGGGDSRDRPGHHRVSEADRSPSGPFHRERNGDRARAGAGFHPLGHQPELLAAAIGTRAVPNAEGDQAVEADRRLAFPDDFAES
jgi:hypothetical protein